MPDQTPAEPQAEVTTKAGRLLLMAGLTFHSGRRLADHAELIVAIEQEVVSRESVGAGLDELLPYLRHTALCTLQAVRDNAPDDELCTCRLRERFLARLAAARPPRGHLG